MARNRTRKRSLQTLPAATLNRIFSYLDPHSAAAAEHTSKCFRAVFQSNDTHVSRRDRAAANVRPYKTIRIRLSGIETLPDGWTEKQFLHFMLPSRTWSGSEACLECTAPSKPFAFIKLHCCAACAARTALSYDQALAHLLQLQPNMAEADACDLLELTPGMLNPTMKRWRLDRCLFARDALNCIYERFRASGLSIMEFAKMQPPSLLQTALIQRIDKCYEYRVMLDATKHDLSEGATMARKRQLTQLFDQKKLPESLRPYLGKMAADYHSHRDFCEDEMAASDHDLRDYCKDELEDLAPNMKQHLELIKQREDGLAITTKLEQHLLGWYIRAARSTFRKTPEKLRALLGDAGKQDNVLQKRLNDEINSICMASLLYELWNHMSTIQVRRKRGTSRVSFDLVTAHRLAGKDGKLTTSDGRHFSVNGQFFHLRCDTASCNDTFNHLASVLDLDQHTLLHDEELSYFSRRLWFVPLIDADSLLLNIESLEKYYIPGHYIRPLPLGAPGTRPMHCVNGWAEHTTRHYNDEHSEPGSYYSYEDLEDCFDSEEDDSDAEADGVGIIEVENESVEDGYSSADDPMSE